MLTLFAMPLEIIKPQKLLGRDLKKNKPSPKREIKYCVPRISQISKTKGESILFEISP
jgi:hypothetical protein